MKRKTRKLLEAADILSSEQIADFVGSPSEFLELARRHRVTSEQVYKACESLGYRWNGRAWLRSLPRWLVRIRDSA